MADRTPQCLVNASRNLEVWSQKGAEPQKGDEPKTDTPFL